MSSYPNKHLQNGYACLEDDGSPSETEANEEAQARALLAPFLKSVALLLSLSLLQSLLISRTFNARSKSWFDPLRIPRFKFWTRTTKKALRWDMTTGMKCAATFRMIKRTAANKYGSSLANSRRERSHGITELKLPVLSWWTTSIYAIGSRPAAGKHPSEICFQVL